MMMFADRVEAGEKLADRLKEKIKERRGLVLGIPRGGVVTAEVVSKKLGWELEVLVTKKISFPGHEELAIGAIAEDGEPVWDEEMMSRQRFEEEKLERQVKESKEKVRRYIAEFREGRELGVKGKTTVLVDDGIATGMTMAAGVKWLREKRAKKVMVAVPVCAKETAEGLRKIVDEWVCLWETDDFMAVGQFYRRFDQVSDEKVKEILREKGS